jgi:DUF1365 family protein
MPIGCSCRGIPWGDVVTMDLVVPALYEADVTHVRRSPLDHSFRYRASYWLVDFDRLPQPRGLARLCGRVRSDDHLDIRSLLSDHGIEATRVLLLTSSRVLGYAFNPISVFWCYDEAGTQRAVVAEVHNTYGDRHAYVLRPEPGGTGTAEKRMYVSPFNRVEGTYRIRACEPAASVSVSVTLERPGEAPFVATLHGTRRPNTTAAMVRSVVRHSGLRNRVLIQWQGVRLWRRGLRVQPR